MSNYVKATNFASKDSLPTGDANKIVKGTEIDNEFNAISGAVSSKSDIASPTFTGVPVAPTAASGTNTTQLATTAFVFAERSATTVLTNKTLTSPTITGGTITGITDLTVADGGTGASTLAANNVLLGNGTNALQTVAPSTSGNVLTSNGTTWTSASLPPSLVGTNGQVFTSTGTFTVPSGITAVKVTVVGGGGNGATMNSGFGAGGGGGGGGVAIRYITGLTSGDTVAVTVGGIAGTSSFGAYASATGGVSGVTNSAAGRAGGTGSNGTYNIAGGAGGTGNTPLTNFIACGGAGGASGGGNGQNGIALNFNIGCTNYNYSTAVQGGSGLFGRGGLGDNLNANNGGAANGFGNGGGSCWSSISTSTGGAGTAGVVIVEW